MSKQQVYATFDKALGLGDEVAYLINGDTFVVQVNRVTTAHGFIIVNGREIMFRQGSGRVLPSFEGRREQVVWPVTDLHRKASERRELLYKAMMINLSLLTRSALEAIISIAEQDTKQLRWDTHGKETSEKENTAKAD